MVVMEGTDQNASSADKALNGSVCQNQLFAQREPCDNKLVEVIEERLPFGLEVLGLAQPGQFLGDGKCQERAENMAADGSIGLVEDRPGIEAGLGGAEHGLDLEQVAIADGGLQGADPGIGKQDGDAIEAGFLGKLAPIDLEGLATGLEITAVVRPRPRWRRYASNRTP